MELQAIASGQLRLSVGWKLTIDFAYKDWVDEGC
jgi:hypothetical protein